MNGILQIIGEHAIPPGGKNGILMTDRLKDDLSIDSLGVMALAVDIEKAFNLDFEMEQITAWETVRDIVQDCGNLMHTGGTIAPVIIPFGENGPELMALNWVPIQGIISPTGEVPTTLEYDTFPDVDPLDKYISHRTRWFFMIGGDDERGPFETADECKTALKNFIEDNSDVYQWNGENLTIDPRISEIDNLITKRRQSGLPYPRTSGALVKPERRDKLITDLKDGLLR